MPVFDADRFAFALAGRVSVPAWELLALRRALSEITSEHRMVLPGLAQRLLASFPARPDFYALVTFLRGDLRLSRALKRATAGPTPRPRSSSPARPRFSLRPQFAGLGLPEIATETSLAAWLGLSPPRLAWLADLSSRNRKHARGPLRPYRYRWIPKRTGTPRLLEIPKRPLKSLQRQILAEILNRIPLHSAVHGFRAGCSIRTNAHPHCGKEAILHFDLEDFFPSVSAARIRRVFLTLGYPPRVALLLAGLCTTLLPAAVWDARPGAALGADFLARQRLVTRHLPQGAPTSPALANLAASRLDRRLAGLARACDATYTRYADDLTFSGTGDLARQRQTLEPLIGAIAREEGFALNHRKTRLMRAGTRQQVTGVVVNVRPNIPRAQYDRLKAILTNCRRLGGTSQNRDRLPDFRAHLLGRIAHIAAIHPKRGEKMRSLFLRIDWSV